MPKFEIDPGYIAGAIDTEGCISISEYVYTRNGSTGINWNPQVIITNTNEHWLRRMRNQCDNIGFIHVDKRTGTAQWRIASDKAADLFNFCKSYLFMKKAQAEVFCYSDKHTRVRVGEAQNYRQIQFISGERWSHKFTS